MNLYSKITFTLAATIAVVALARCARDTDEKYRTKEQRSLDVWMEQNHPGVQRLESGMYIEWLRPSDPARREPETGDWLQLMYRGTTLDGEVFVSRYRDEAIDPEGTFSWFAHYVPDYLNFYKYTGLTTGEIVALSMMREGDSVRLYLPSTLAYRGSTPSFYPGFEGWALSKRNDNRSKKIGRVPVIIELVLRGVIEDENAYEYNQVVARAAEWGLAESDTVRRGLYMLVLDDDTSSPIIGQDTAVYIEYTGRFLDDFLLDTNITSVYESERRDYSTSFKPAKFTSPSDKSKTSDGDETFIDAFYQAFNSRKIRYNSRIRMVFTSDWAYKGTQQDADATSPNIYPYTPLMFEIRTLPQDYDPDATNE